MTLPKPQFHPRTIKYEVRLKPTASHSAAMVALTLGEVVAHGVEELAELKRQTRLAKEARAEKRVKRLAGDSLKDREPW